MAIGPTLPNQSRRHTLFETKSEAAWYLGGLSGFWAGFAVICLAWLATAPGVFILVGIAILLAGWIALSRAMRRLEERLSGRHVRRWPLGYPGFRTQVKATLPSTVIAAADRLDANVVLVTSAVYALLALDLIAFVAMWSVRR